ncbi:hypothetical protein B296_00027727 [Ensete ventricosum]|uniref:Uncharacterized protein n=1 Tax=Ensete ventricosum TaxID=4639 RepID=A0A426Z3I1_ENSVE|nr:hypothetical protein B296_00027727 [Ensete ventricosum]
MGIGSGSDDAIRPRQEFARRFAEGIEKLVGNTPGDHRKKTGILATRMLEAARSMGGGCQRLNHPGLAGEPLVPSLQAVDSE